jgi:branched-chain amino acid transport system permease protein
MILYSVLIKFYEFSGGTDGLAVRGFALAGVTPAHPRLVQYYLVLVLTAAVVYVGARFLASPLRYLMQAVRYNEIRIEYLGASASHAILASYVVPGHQRPWCAGRASRRPRVPGARVPGVVG